MEAEQQHQESANINSLQSIAMLNGANIKTLPKLPPANKGETQWQRIARQITRFLEKLLEDLGNILNKNRKSLLSLASILLAIITLKVILAVLDAIDDIPLISPLFELMGIGLVIWFIFRYLSRASTRQELVEEIHSFREQIVG